MVMQAVYDMNMQKLHDAELNDKVFSAPVKKSLLFDAVRAHRANCRQGNASTKTRAEVNGSGKKIYRQKGTGRARHGDAYAPIFVGGGVAFGPKPRDWSMGMNKKIRRAALKSALSMKRKTNELTLVDKWSMPSGKTKDMSEVVKKWGKKSSLFVLEVRDDVTLRSMRNLRNIKIVRPDAVTVYDLLRFDHLFLTEKAAVQICEALSK